MDIKKHPRDLDKTPLGTENDKIEFIILCVLFVVAVSFVFWMLYSYQANFIDSIK